RSLRSPSMFTLFPYTTLFRSCRDSKADVRENGRPVITERQVAHFNFSAKPERLFILFGHPFAVGDFRLSVENGPDARHGGGATRSEEHTSELQSRENLVCRLL